MKPALIVSYVWIGDFVRCHSVVKLLRAQHPDRPVDIVASSLCAPLADYMPGLRKAIVADLPRRSLPLSKYRALAARLREEDYGQAIVMLRTWKSALAPFLAGIPLRTGFLGELRFPLLNDIRFGERKQPRMIDQMGALATPRGAARPPEWPLPELRVPQDEAEQWRERHGLVAEGRPVVCLAPGAVGEGKAWPPEHYAMLASALTAEGCSVWVIGGPGEKETAARIVATAGKHAHDVTGNDVRDAILALAASDAAVTNDSGLLHVAAAIGTPTAAIFGPTSPWHWKPLNPVAAILEPPGDEAAKIVARTEGNSAVKHRRTADVPVATVLDAVRKVLDKKA